MYLVGGIEMSRRTTLLTIGLLTVGSSAALATAARAQIAPTRTGEASGTTDSNGGDIVVTARKRDEPLSKTPIAIVALRGEALRERGLTSLEDIATVTPGVSFREDVGGRAGPAITIRGIGFDDYHAGGSRPRRSVSTRSTRDRAPGSPGSCST